jgi:hypothetical protein
MITNGESGLPFHLKVILYFRNFLLCIHQTVKQIKDGQGPLYLQCSRGMKLCGCMRAVTEIGTTATLMQVCLQPVNKTKFKRPN